MHRVVQRRYRIVSVVAILLIVGICVMVFSKREKEFMQPEMMLQSADCTAWLLRNGIAVKQPPLAVERICLPSEINKVYEAYLRLQKFQGLSAEEHLGETATLYLYETDTVPSDWITLIVSDGELIAADRTGSDRIPLPLL